MLKMLSEKGKIQKEKNRKETKGQKEIRIAINGEHKKIFLQKYIGQNKRS